MLHKQWGPSQAGDFAGNSEHALPAKRKARDLLMVRGATALERDTQSDAGRGNALQCPAAVHLATPS